MDKDVSEFLQGSFRSVWSLELLLVLQGQPDRAWTPQELIAELRSSEAVVRQGIGDLLAAGMIVTEGDDRVRYGPASATLRDLMPRVIKAYQVESSNVRRLIVHRPSEKLRNFSDAFKISGKD